jgi:hypothetical protein
MFPLLFMLLQPQLRATQPTYFLLVVVLLLIAGGVGWLIAAVLGFARGTRFRAVAGVRAFSALVFLRGCVPDHLSPAFSAVWRVRNARDGAKHSRPQHGADCRSVFQSVRGAWRSVCDHGLC